MILLRWGLSPFSVLDFPTLPQLVFHVIKSFHLAMVSQFIYVRDFYLLLCILFCNILCFVTVEYLQTYSYLFTSENTGPAFTKSHARRTSEISISSNNSPIVDNLNLPNISSSKWPWLTYKLYFNSNFLFVQWWRDGGALSASTMRSTVLKVSATFPPTLCRIYFTRVTGSQVMWFHLSYDK